MSLSEWNDIRSDAGECEVQTALRKVIYVKYQVKDQDLFEKAVRNSITIYWIVRENACAQMRVIIKRILRKYGYPPDKQSRATELVLEQAEVVCHEWAMAG